MPIPVLKVWTMLIVHLHLLQKNTLIFCLFFVIIMLLKLLEIDAGGTSRAEKTSEKNPAFKLK